MSMSTHVKGFKPPDDRWRAMKAIWDGCQAADVEVPDEVERYFEDGEPDGDGVEVSQSVLEAAGAVREWSDKYRQGFEIVRDKLPKDVTVVRVYNSW